MDELLSRYFSESIQVLQRLDQGKIELMVELLRRTRDRSGRLFILGVGKRGQREPFGIVGDCFPSETEDKCYQMGILLSYAFRSGSLPRS
jgi:hypothetical protein